MKIVRTPAEARSSLGEFRRAGRRIGFVPTMGMLHEGHLSLIRLAMRRNNFTVVSIFVNPKQFVPGEDFMQYPRDESRDAGMLEEIGCDMLFLPADRDLYSPEGRTRIDVEDLANRLCGASRSGHFQGVLLIVAKLLNIVQPDEAFFGQKDAQQAVVVQRMVADLDFPVRIVIGRTAREPDGLAMSSRNEYLEGQERARAAALYKALSEVKRLIEGGERDAEELISAMRRVMKVAGVEVDYTEVVDGRTLRSIAKLEGIVLVAVAGRVGRARLIDNMAFRISGDTVEEILLEFPEWSRYAGRK